MNNAQHRLMLALGLSTTLLNAPIFAASAGDATHAGATVALAGTSIATTGSAQPAPAPAATAPAAPSLLAHEKYTLPNGMTVILHVDKSLPVATINTWYRVGAKNEPKGRSGFAHLFEHLMFMGTKRVPGSDFDVLMENGGGANNASTSLDRTNYFSWGPSSLLPTLLWLDADRLEDLGPQMTAEKLKKQQDVVRNEIRQNVENTPYARAFETANQFLYPESHPYHWNVYGLHEDLEAATTHDVKDFFATFYAPNNASLVVAGDFDPAVIKPLVAELFGTLPRGNVPQDRPVPPAALDRVVRTNMLDKVQQPMVMICWHSPAAYTPGDAELTLAGLILSDGQSSRLYKRLVVQDQLAVSVSASQDSSQLGSVFRVVIMAKPEADLTRVEQIVSEEIAALAKSGPTEAELKARQATIESGTLSALQSLMSRADKLNEYEYYFGNPDSLEADLNRYRNTTPKTLAAALTKYVGTGEKNGRLVSRVLPEESERAKTARDTRPADAQTAPFSATAPTSFALSNGINVRYWHRPGTNLVSARAIFNTGKVIDDPQTAGLASLTSDMLSEGVSLDGKDLDGAAVASSLQLLGAGVGAGASKETISLSLSTLSRTFKDAAPLWAASAISPRMNAADFDRVKSLHLAGLEQEDDEPTIVAARVGMRALFGSSNPYGSTLSGSKATVEPITLDNVKTFRNVFLRPDFTTIFIAGDVSEQDARSILEGAFGGWKATSSIATSPMDLNMPSSDGLRVLLVDRPGAVQTVINFYAPGTPAASADRIPLRLINTILGGSFTSRLNQNLREKNGFTYGAGSRHNHTRHLGWFMARSSVKSETTGLALKEFMSEFEGLRAGNITQDELDKAKKTARTELIQDFSTLSGYVSVGAGLLEDNLDWASLATDLQAIDKLTLAQVNAEAKPAINLERGLLVMVGDKATILTKIKEAGVSLPPIVEVDAQGRIVRDGSKW
ncbi:MAG: insulinase family protein [Phycisphaerales bacterium]|nr:insulinase family protein [Phycisphaerales bacterium]